MSFGRKVGANVCIDVGTKALAVDGAVEDAGCGDAAAAQAGDQRGDLPVPMPMRHRRQQPQPAGRPTEAARHFGGRPKPAPAQAGVNRACRGGRPRKIGAALANRARFSWVTASPMRDGHVFEGTWGKPSRARRSRERLSRLSEPLPYFGIRRSNSDSLLIFDRPCGSEPVISCNLE